jgi:hypothetical protein
MGIRASGKRILLLFDVSQSVANKASKSGMPLSRIKEETLALLDTLPSSSRFGIIQFSQNYKPFRTELLPANDPNREAVREWVAREWVETGTLSGSGVTSNPKGLVGVLELAAKMQPDVVFIISDGSFQWRPEGAIGDIPWEEVSDALKGLDARADNKVRVHVVAFQVDPDDKAELRRLVGRTGGKLREIK